MKKQLQKHEEELAHPVWMDSLMEEVNKIPVLLRKIEHCQLDINNLRELFSSSHSVHDNHPTSPMKLVGEKKEIMEKIQHLFNDLEGIRLVMRRIDVQNALQANVLVKVTGNKFQ